MDEQAYKEEIRAGLLGKAAGVRLGAFYEFPRWSRAMIKKQYGTIDHYMKGAGSFSADDDLNVPLFMIRSVEDAGEGNTVSAEDVGNAWLNYTRPGRGMFWWGGKGVATEDTAYQNLSAGIKAPKSGSSALNGKMISEQIGGQIFIDSWGLICPDDYQKAGALAEQAASVSHDGEGREGARFVGACVSLAFHEKNPVKIVAQAITVLDPNSQYCALAEDIFQYHEEHADSTFENCLNAMDAKWNFASFPGGCHIIPNAAVVIISLLYSEGELAKAITIAVDCAMDTDSDAGTVGAIMGVCVGIENIPTKFLGQINDTLQGAGFSGALNITDIPTEANYLYALNQIVCHQDWSALKALHRENINFDFSYTNATHGFETTNELKAELHPENHLTGADKPGSLRIFIDQLASSDQNIIVYRKFFHRLKDFPDERYNPVFTPQVYSGQKVTAKFYMERYQGNNLFVTPVVKTGESDDWLRLDSQLMPTTGQYQLEFRIPDTLGDNVQSVGFEFSDSTGWFGNVYLTQMTISGPSEYSISFVHQSDENGTVTPFSRISGSYKLMGQAFWLDGQTQTKALTGAYYATPVMIRSEFAQTQHQFDFHFGVTGLRSGYRVAVRNGQVTLYRYYDGEEKKIAEGQGANEVKLLTLKVELGKLQIKLNQTSVLTAALPTSVQGLYGFQAEGEDLALLRVHTKTR